MTPINKETHKNSRMGDVWFNDRFGELRNPQYNQSTTLEMLFRQLLWRIQELEQEVNGLKSSSGAFSDIIQSGTAADIPSTKKPQKRGHPDIIDDENL